MAGPRIMKAKVCLVGEGAVGKTSLIRRFTLSEFDDVYIATIAAKVTKRIVEVTVPPDGTRVLVEMTIWDVMGHKRYRQLLDDFFFMGASGILAVADITRKETLSALYEWVGRVDAVSSRAPVVIAMNKSDLENEAAVTEADIGPVANDLRGTYVTTSAKTGEGVEEAFQLLAARMAERAIKML